MAPPLSDDIAAIARISAVPTILRVIAETTGMGYTLVARVTPGEWIACAVHDQIAFGLKVGDELDVATTFCSEVRDSLQPFIIEHASREPTYFGHPTPKMYGFESYIAVPVYRKTGEYFGNVCALDRKPCQLREPKTVAMMKLFAELISLQLEAEETHAQAAADLLEQRTTGELREQFIAVLGHDLRNPLGSIVIGSEVLLEQGIPEAARSTVGRIRKSAQRIELLVDDLLDLTRGRLGGGISIEPAEIPDLEQSLRHVVDEIASQHPGRPIRFHVEGAGTLIADRRRIEQVLSNLLGNAMHHGKSNEPVEVSLRHLPDGVTLSVKNSGAPIPAAVQSRLFQPFYRVAGGTRQGLGLGLYIVAEIAKAHRGSASVSSVEGAGTTFSVRLPKSPR
jgi:signal transduction histidine kinase